MATGLELTTAQLGSCAVLTIGGEVDLGTADQLGDAAVAALGAVSPRLVLDLAGVGFMDSSGIKVLLALQRRATQAGGMLRLARPTRSVHRVLTVTGVGRALPIHDSVDAAVASYVDGH